MSIKEKNSRIQLFNLRLNQNLMLAFLSIALIPIFILTVTSSIDQTNQEKERAAENLSAQTDIVQGEIEDWIIEGEFSLQQVLADRRIRPSIARLASNAEDTPAQVEFRNNIQNFMGEGRFFNQITLVGLDGNVLSSNANSMIELTETLAGEVWFTDALDNPDFNFFGDLSVQINGPMHDPLDNQDSIYFSMVMRFDRASDPVAILVGRTSVEAFQTRVAGSITSNALSGSTEYYIVKEGRQYIIPPASIPSETLADSEILDEALVRPAGSNSEADADGEAETEADITTRNIVYNSQWTDYAGNRVIGSYTWIEDLEFSLIFKQNVSDLQGGSRALIISHIRAGFIVALIAIAASIVVSRQIVKPLEELSDVASQISEGNFDLNVPQTEMMEIKALGEAMNSMMDRLRGLIQSRDETVAARTQQIEITSKIGHAITSETNLDKLLQLTVNMIRDQLGHYHAQVFMLDDLQQYAVLRTSTGNAGRILLDRGHKLAVGSDSVVGQAASKGEPILASDTRFADFWMPNPLLPDTRAEVAIPVRLGERIIGTLDVQDTETEAFDEGTISALQVVADQLAIAIRNAQLFDEKESLLSASLQLTQTLTREGWDNYTEETSGDELLGFQYDLATVTPLTELPTSGNGGGNSNQVAMPIELRGTVIGDMMAELPEGQKLSASQEQFVGQVLERVALALENARLFDQTQISLSETHRLYNASQEIAAAGSIEDLIEQIIQLSISERIDRIFVYQLDDPNEAVDEKRWVETIGQWYRKENDPLQNLPDRILTGQPPLQGIEDIPVDGLTINHLAENSEINQNLKTYLINTDTKAIATYPLVAGRRTIGWLTLHSTTQQKAFNEADERFFKTIADQAATALESLRLFQQAQIRARRLQATNEVSQIASSILNPDILLPMIVDRISEAFNYYHAQIFLIDDLGEWAVLRASTGEVGEELLRREHKLAVGSQSVIGQVTTTGTLVIARDTDTDAVHRRNELLPNTRAEMALPLKTGDRVIGALDVQSVESNAFDVEAQGILQSLADEISVTLENATLFQEIQDRVAELTTVNLVSQAVSRAQTLDDLYEIVTLQMMRTFGSRYGFLGVINEDKIFLPIFLEDGERQPSPPPNVLGQGLTSHVINSKEVLLINENLEERAVELGAVVIGTLPHSLLAVPLLLGDEVIGVISLQDAERENAYTDAHVRQLTTLAAYIAVKIRNAELLQEAQLRVNELGFLFNVTRAAVGASDLDESLTSVVGILGEEISNVENSMVYLTDESGRYIEPHAIVGYGVDIPGRFDPVPIGEGLAGLVADKGRALIIADAQQPPYNLPEEERTRSAVLVPLQVVDTIIGVLAVESSEPDIFDDGVLRLLETAASTLTAIIQNARLLEEITMANEQLKEVDRLKGEFLANMSHELRTPLNSIIGFSRVMLKGIDGPLNDIQTQDLSTIYNSGNHLLGLINDILDLSKLESRMMEINAEYLDFGTIIEGVLATGRGLVNDKEIVFYIDIEKNLPQVYGDQVRLRQVLLNLTSNAAKFTHEGSITIRATRKGHDLETGEPPRAQIEVIDTGIGIPADKYDTIFEAFQQADGSTTRQYGGTGLGLPISKNFIELHGGRMWIESEEGVGSSFIFTVPLHPADLEEAELELSDDTGDEDDNRPVVLTVDDEQGVLDLYARYLEKEGYVVARLNNANDLVTHAVEVNPAAILLDLNLPGKDGWQALQELKESGETHSIPVIICSIDNEAQRATDAGAIASLVKPIIEDDLLSTLRGVIKDSNGGAKDNEGSKAVQVEHIEEIILRKVLIVNSDPDHAQQIAAVLETIGGFETRVANFGFEVLASAQAKWPDAFIMTFNFSDMDGYGLIDSMQTHDTTKDIPTFILTEEELSGEDLEKLNHPFLQYINIADYQEDIFTERLIALFETYDDAMKR